MTNPSRVVLILKRLYLSFVGCLPFSKSGLSLLSCVFFARRAVSFGLHAAVGAANFPEALCAGFVVAVEDSQLHLGLGADLVTRGLNRQKSLVTHTGQAFPGVAVISQQLPNSNPHWPGVKICLNNSLP